MKFLARLKTLLPLLAGLVAVPAAHAQTPVTTWAQSYGVASFDNLGNPYTDYYYGSGSDVPMGVVAMPDGGMVVAGGLDQPALYYKDGNGTGHNGNSCTALVRYAADGSILWQELLRQDNDTYNGDYDEYDHQRNQVYQLLADAQGNIFARINKGGAAHAGVIAKFDPNGTMLWQSAFGSDAYQDNSTPPNKYDLDSAPPVSMSLTADGGVVIAGSEGASAGYSLPFFAKINADGGLGVHSPFTNIGQYDGAGAAAQSADGQHFLVAIHGSMVLMDASGAKVAERTFGNDIGVGETPSQAIGNADGTFTVLTVGYSNPGGTYHFNVACIVRKLNADLTPVWEKIISLPAVGGTISPTNDGGYLLTGLADANTLSGQAYGSTSADAVVARLDANGNLVSAFLLGGPATEGPEGALSSQGSTPFVAQLADGGFGVAVNSYSYHVTDTADHPDWWVVKTDATGRAQNFDGNMSPVSLTTFAAHDNTAASTASNNYEVPGNYLYTGGIFYDAAPSFIIQDLGNESGINRPTVLVQAAPFAAPVLTTPTGLEIATTLPPETGPLEEWEFVVNESSTATGLSVRVQYNLTPDVESGWTDLPGGGQMVRNTTNTSQWGLGTTNIPLSSAVGGPFAYRVIAAAPGYADAVTGPSDLYNVTESTTPVYSGSAGVTFQKGTSAYFNFVPLISVPSGYTADTLPDGLYLDSSYSQGYISGTPTTAGVYAVHITASAANNRRLTFPFTITVIDPQITSALSVVDYSGQPFSYQIKASVITPVSYSTDGLPPGLTLDTTKGLITGTNSSYGGIFNIYATDANGFTASAQLNIDLETGPAPTPTPTPTPTPAAGSDDLGVTVTVSPNPVVQNGLATYHVVVTNAATATATATGVAVTVQYDASETFVAQGSASANVLANNVLIVPVADLAAGGNAPFDLIFRVTASGGSVSLSAKVSGTPDDSNAFNDSQTLLTTVNGGTAAAHAPTINAPAGGVIVVGEKFAYTITTAEDVPVDTFGATGLPNGLSVDPASGGITGVATADNTLGSHSVTLSASNGAGRSTSTRTFTLLAAPTGKAVELVSTLSDTKIIAPAGGVDATSGKFKVKGKYTLANLGKRAAKKVAVSVYLSTSPNFSFPASASDPSVLQVPVYVDTTTDPAHPSLHLQLAGAVTPSVVIPRLGKTGAVDSAYGPLSFVFKVPAAVLQAASAKYRYVLVVADPGDAIPEADKGNDVAVLDLQSAQ